MWKVYLSCSIGYCYCSKCGTIANATCGRCGKRILVVLSAFAIVPPIAVCGKFNSDPFTVLPLACVGSDSSGNVMVLHTPWKQFHIPVEIKK